MITRRRAAMVVLLVGLASIVIAAHGRPAPSEFAGEGWYQGRVLVCKRPGSCTQLRYPLPGHETIYVDLRVASTGEPSSGLAVDNDGTFGSWAPPGAYEATLRPRTLDGLHSGTVRVRMTADGRVAFDIAYGTPRR